MEKFPRVEGAEAFCAARSYIATARKHDIAVLDALRDAFTRSPWLPPHQPPPEQLPNRQRA